MRVLLTIGCALAMLIADGSARAEGWGDLTGQFVLSGAAPKPAPLVVPPGAGCGAVKLVDESIVVGPNKGIKNIVVYLFLKEGDKAPTAHPDYDKAAKAEIMLDNDNCRFEPRIALLRTTQTLVVGNKDAVGHNTNIACIDNKPENPIIPPGASIRFWFPKTERLPTNVSCNIHPWMSARVLIRDNPYFAVTDENGKFTIKNVPAGARTFQFWHERIGYLNGLTQDGKSLAWAKGRTGVTIVPKGIDLGKIEVDVGAFKK